MTFATAWVILLYDKVLCGKCGATTWSDCHCFDDMLT